MSKTALLMIDFQNDYFTSCAGAKLPLKGAEAASEHGARLLDAFRKKGFLVVHVRHENLKKNAPFFVPGSVGAEIHPSVAPIGGETVIVKHRANSFLDTGLKEALDRNKVTDLVIAGAMSNMCVDAVTRAAADLGYKCAVAHDACAARDLEFNGVAVPALQVHTAFMAALNSGYARVAGTDELLAGLGR